jgi:hypothetical protein
MYVTLPDVQSARQLANDLLLARIEDRHMHFLARRGTDLGELHEASYIHKTDMTHAAFVGLVLGGALGAVLGAVLVNFPPGRLSVELGAVLIATIVGAGLGMWISSMVGLQVPNSRLKHFEPDIAAGKVLLLLDVPAGRYQEIHDIIARTHPEAVDGGNEPTVPAFP